MKKNLENSRETRLSQVTGGYQPVHIYYPTNFTLRDMLITMSMVMMSGDLESIDRLIPQTPSVTPLPCTLGSAKRHKDKKTKRQKDKQKKTKRPPKKPLGALPVKMAFMTMSYVYVC